MIGNGMAAADMMASAIANAVADALREFDIDIVATAITPGMVRQLIRAATPPTTAADESAQA